MTINTVGTLNLSTEFGALFVFSAFIETLDFFLSRNASSVLHVECKGFEVVYVLQKKLLFRLFFFSPTKIIIFFSATLGIRIVFLETPPPFKLNGRSLTIFL
jgi:hypothetical protein